MLFLKDFFGIKKIQKKQKKWHGSLYHYVCMQPIIDKLHYHGKRVYRHAKKHHKKYLWGAVGFFWLFKLFSFLLLSLAGYTAIQTNITQARTPFTIWTDNFDFFIGDPKCGKEIIETAETIIYPCIQGEAIGFMWLMRFSFKNIEDLATQERIAFSNDYPLTLPEGTVDSVILYAQYAYDPGVPWKEVADDVIITNTTPSTGTMDPFDFFIGDERCIESTTTNRPSDSTANLIYLCVSWSNLNKMTVMRFSNSGLDYLSGEKRTDYSNTYQWDLWSSPEGKTNIFAEYGYTTGDTTIKTGSITMSVTSIWSGDIAGSKIVSSGDNILTDNMYRIIKSTNNNDQITLNSVDTSSTISVGLWDRDGKIMAPTPITDDRKAAQGETWLPEDFIPTQTILVGADWVSLTMSNNVKFDISFQVTGWEISQGTTLPIYYSYDGNNRNILDVWCTVDATNMCTFSSSHLTLFAVGTTGSSSMATRNNTDFINQRFRDTDPTTGQIIYALFGSWSDRSAYTYHRTNNCTPTSVNIIRMTKWTKWPINLTGNNVYILESGDYISTGTISISWNCIAIVGSGTVTIKKNFGGNLLYAVSKNNIIIDNIQINGNENTGYLMGLQTVGSITMNDIQTYHNSGTSIIFQGWSGALINNIQMFNNKGIGLRLWLNTYSTINNSKSYNNTQGIYILSSTWITINNSQVYNNKSDYGILVNNTKLLAINNIQSYNNGAYGISLVTNTTGVRINNSKIFNNNSGNTQVYVDGTSNWWYNGDNIAYPNAWFNNLLGNIYDATLLRAEGHLYTTDLWFNCDFVNNPINWSGNWMYNNSYCNQTGYISPTWTGYAIVKYFYGNNILLGNYVMRQIAPVVRSWSTLSLSKIPYHGHRFIGEYDDDIDRDINIPIAFFTWETPPLGYNVNNTWYFRVRAYVYEPNLASLWRNEDISGSNMYYSIYNKNMVLMMNFDSIKEIGEVWGVVRDLSLYKNIGIVNWSTARTSNGKWNGAFSFASAGDRITTLDNPNLRVSTDFTLSTRVKRNTTNTSHQIFFYDNCASTYTTAYGVDIYSDNKLRLVFQSGTTSNIATSTATIGTSRTHVAITHTNNYTYFYINGILNTWVYHPYNPFYASWVGSTNCNWLAIGQYADGIYTNSQMNGYIDEVRIYDIALSNWDIDMIYRSNLSSKPDHREYVVDYTGVGWWSIGTHTFWFPNSYYIKDSNQNEIIPVTWYVVKSQSCTWSLIGWNNDNFINSGFWNSNPGFCDIVIALFGTGLAGNDTTAYTNNRSGWNTSTTCNDQNMSIVYLTWGINKLPNYMPDNTIYVLASGNYLQDYEIRMGACSAIIGQTGSIKLYGTLTLPKWLILMSSNPKNIIDNFYIYGIADGSGWTHAPNANSISSVWAYRTINNIKSFESIIGIDGKDNMYDTTNNTTIYSGEIGIKYTNSVYSIISDSQTYNATQNGISIEGWTNFLTTNNIQSYNNGSHGIKMNIDGTYITINNSQIFNNGGDGIFIDLATYYPTINNTHIFNNSGNGISFINWSNSGILNNVWIYNNGLTWIHIGAWTHKYYGRLTIFANNTNTLSVWLTAWLSSTYTSLWWTWGSLDTGQCMNCARTTNPQNSSYITLINTATYPKCQMRGISTVWSNSENINYTYGINLTGQKIPVFYSGTILTNSSIVYSGNKYVAETNKLSPDYTNTQCSCSGHTYRWNNNSFLDTWFRNNGTQPDYCDIIAAVYGTGGAGQDTTAYNKNRGSQWTGQCNVENVEVKYMTWGTGKIDYLMNDHTIYVLGSGNYIQTGTIYANWCNGILWKTGNIVLYSTTWLSNGMISNVSTRYSVFDNLRINWTWWGPVPNHTNNRQGIYFDTALSNTINNIQTYNNYWFGIYIVNSLNNIINNNQTYNNDMYGIGIDSFSEDNIFNNIQSYNNGSMWILIGENAFYNTFNNIQSYNNNSNGIQIGSFSSGNTLNNVQSYNNWWDWIIIQEGSHNNNLNNIWSYNNERYGIETDSSDYNKYFGTGKFFNNGSWNIYLMSSTDLITGIFNSVGRSPGILITTGTMSWDYITNPTTISNYFLPWTGLRTGIRAQQNNYLYTTTDKYSYGSGILLQIEPVYYNWAVLQAGGIFSWIKYIWSSITRYTWLLSWITSTITNVWPFTVTWLANQTYINTYSLFGDIASYKIGQTINTSTGISVTAGVGAKRIVTQIYSGGDFATHFQTDTSLMGTISCASRWNNDNFITGAFWTNGTPTDQNIICALYGTGAGDPNGTAYTKFRNGRNTTQCSGTQITVIKTGNLNITTLASNTIYVLTWQISTGTTSITLASCSAIISSQSTWTTFYSTTYATNGMFYGNAKNYVIFDNITINGSGNWAGWWHTPMNNYYGIQLLSNQNNSFNMVRVQDNTVWIRLYNDNNGYISNSQFYNNTEGIHMLIWSNNTINNSQFYNNSIGITGTSSSYNSINNSQFYNNNYWIYISACMISMNTSQFFNNASGGIYITNSPNTNINNSKIYNNDIGINIDSNSTSGKYYGTSFIFGNKSSNITGTTTNLITGTFNSVWWTVGELITTGIFSWEYVTNPINTINNYLISWTGLRTWIMWPQSTYLGKTTDKHSYGSGILLQTQPVYYTGSTLQTGWIFDVTKYIWSSITRYTWSLSWIASSSYTTWLFTVTGLANATWISNYSLFWDIFAYKIWQSINTSTGIYLLSWDGTKRIVTQIYSGTNFSTHFQTDTSLINSQIVACELLPANAHYYGWVTTYNITQNRNYQIPGREPTSGAYYEDNTPNQYTCEYACDNNFTRVWAMEVNLGQITLGSLTFRSILDTEWNVWVSYIGEWNKMQVKKTSSTGLVLVNWTGVSDYTLTSDSSLGLWLDSSNNPYAYYWVYNTTPKTIKELTGSSRVQIAMLTWDKPRIITDYENNLYLLSAVDGTRQIRNNITQNWSTGTFPSANTDGWWILDKNWRVVFGGTNYMYIYENWARIKYTLSKTYTNWASSVVDNVWGTYRIWHNASKLLITYLSSTGNLTNRYFDGTNGLANIAAGYAYQAGVVDSLGNLRVTTMQNNFWVAKYNGSTRQYRSWLTIHGAIDYGPTIRESKLWGIRALHESFVDDKIYWAYYSGWIRETDIEVSSGMVNWTGTMNKVINTNWDTMIWYINVAGEYVLTTPEEWCSPEQVSAACQDIADPNGVFINGLTWYIVYQTWNGTSWIPTTWSYYDDGILIANTCEYMCKDNYIYSWSLCVTIPPIVGQAYISSWVTGMSVALNNYYKWIIDISGAVSDNLWLNTGTCMYTTGSTRAPATYSGTVTTGYCYATGLNPLATINIRFKIEDNEGNTTTWATGTYIYDVTPPSTWTIVINNNNWITHTWIVTLTISDCPSDNVGWIWFSGIYIDNITNPTTNFNAGCPGTISSRVLSGWDWIRTVYMRAVDKLWNTWANFSDSIIVDAAVDCAARWNNDNFITGAFRTNGTPADDNIICALYGTGPGDTTAYTKSWSGRDTTQCSGIEMNVVYTGNLNITTLASNTIYVLTWQVSTWAASINMANCSAIISNQSTGTTFHSTTYLFLSMFEVSNTKQNIFDNISINWTWWGPVPSHSGNNIWIYERYSQNTTINNVQVYNHEGRWIRLRAQPTWYTPSYNESYTTINNVNSFNNWLGIDFYCVNNNTISNTKTYNNNGYGFLFDDSKHTNIDNIQSYNNDYGIVLWTDSSYTTVNNSQIYNNSAVWIGLSSSSNIIINNTQIYNNMNNNGLRITYAPNIALNNIQVYNNSYWINIDTFSTVKYYGNTVVFNNTLGDIIWTLSIWLSNDFPWIWRNAGILKSTGTMSRDYITNPINTIGSYLVPWTGTRTEIIGQKNYTGSTTDKYSYGSGILTQVQPVYYSWNTLKTWGIFDATKYIWSFITKYTWSLLWLPTSTINQWPFTVTWLANLSYINKYSLFGNITSYKIGQAINTSTGISLTAGIESKRVVTQIYSGLDFATHFQTNSILGTPCTIEFTGTTPAAWWWTLTGNNFKPQIQISWCTIGIDTFNYTMNGTTYPYYDSWLLLMYNFDNIASLWETTGIAKDFSFYWNHWSWYGWITWNSNGRWNGAYMFNWSNGYISWNNIWLSGNATFTIAYWMKRDWAIRDWNYPSAVWNSTTTVNRWLSTTRQNWRPALDFRNNRYRATTALQTGQRYYVTFTKTPWLISTTSKIYVNWQLVAWTVENTDTTPDILDSQLTIWRLDATRRFSGAIDEVRIRNRALSSGEILQMWRSNFAKYDTGNRLFTDDRQCVVSGTYNYTWYVLNTWQLSATTGRQTNVNISGRNITRPLGYYIWSTPASTSIVSLSGQFTGNFRVDDRKWTSWRYTSIQSLIRYTGINHNSYISYNNSFFMATGIDTSIVPGTTATNAVYVNPTLGTYQTGNTILTYIQRDYITSEYSCPAWVYGNKPYVKINIPAYQIPDVYSGGLEIYLYE